VVLAGENIISLTRRFDTGSPCPKAVGRRRTRRRKRRRRWSEERGREVKSLMAGAACGGKREWKPLGRCRVRLRQDSLTEL